MLVLSRKQRERLLLPDIATSLEIIKVRGDVVRIGIEAPKDIIVLREELSEGRDFQNLIDNFAQARKVNHSLRGSLHVLQVGYSMLMRQIAAGVPEKDLFTTLQAIQDEFSKLEVPTPQPQKTIRKALIVEDDINERVLMAGMLRMSGMEVVEAKSGREAIDYIRACDRYPDVVLLDMGLPDLDGAQVAKEIRAVCGNNIRIYVVSGRERTSEPEIDAWFSKPVNPEKLVDNLSRLRICV